MKRANERWKVARYSTRSRDWFPTHLSRENIFLCPRQSQFSKSFRDTSSYILWNTLYYDSIVSSAETFFFLLPNFSSFSFFSRKKKKKERKTLKTFYKILSLFSLKNFICHFSKEITVPQDTIDHSMSTNHRTISRIQTWNRVPDFHITEIFVPFQELRLLDKLHAATRRRLRVSRTLSTTRVRSFHERLHVGSKATRLRVPEIKRSGARPIRRDSSKFFLRSNDLDKLKSVKTSRYLSTVL